jgi:AcrR family transcriptional regulator
MTAPRSRLSADRQAEIMDAVIDQLRTVGYESVTMDAIAATARTSKATLYRQWGGLPGLVVAAIEHYHPRTAVDVNTGTLRGDLIALIDHHDDKSDDVIRAVFVDEDLRTAMRARMMDPTSLILDAILARAAERGEVDADSAALPYIAMMLAAFSITHVFLRGSPATAADFAAYIDSVVVPLLTAKH